MSKIFESQESMPMSTDTVKTQQVPEDARGMAPLPGLRRDDTMSVRNIKAEDRRYRS